MSARRSLKIYLAAFGDAGHAFPMMALGRALVARGHGVSFETWARWARPVADAGMEFLPAPEYPVFPTQQGAAAPGSALSPFQAVVRSVPVSRAAIAERGPDVVVHDILTLAPALAAELCGVRTATLIPHLYPVSIPGCAPFGLGARPPRTAVARSAWRLLQQPSEYGLRLGRSQLNETRRRVGLPPTSSLYGGMSRSLCLVATFPALEYPRAWPAHVHVTGPLLWAPEPAATAATAAAGATSDGSGVADANPQAAVADAHPRAAETHAHPQAAETRAQPPSGGTPLVLVAPSTAQDPAGRLLRSALTALARMDVRVIAATNGRALPEGTVVGANTQLAGWLSYARTLPDCALVVTHAGHGTLAWALAAGVPVLAVPHGGDMPETAARVDWAGVGLRLPWRFVSPLSVRLAVERMLHERGRFAAAARAIADWSAVHDGPTRAAELVETLATR